MFWLGSGHPDSKACRCLRSIHLLPVPPDREVVGWLVGLGFKVALHDIDDQRLSEELLYSTYIVYLFTSGPIDSLYTLYINYLHYIQ